MAVFREYAVSVIATTLICTAISSLIHNSAVKGMFKLVTGIILCISVVAPLLQLDFSITDTFESLALDGGNIASAAGKKLSQDALRAIIKKDTEAYIQDKAADLNADIMAHVILNQGDPPIPERVVLSGRISPYAKQQLQKILKEQLGIPKENLEWTG